MYEYDADHPGVLVGGDEGPTPVEFLLHGLAACLTAGIANIAAARGVTLTEVTSRIEGDINLRGLLGLSNEVRNGYERIRVTFDIKGDAPAEKLRGDRGAVPGPLGGLRRPHERRPGRDRRECGLTTGSAAGSSLPEGGAPGSRVARAWRGGKGGRGSCGGRRRW